MTHLMSVFAVLGGIATFSLALLGMMAAGNALLGAEPEWINRTAVTQLAWLAWNVVSMIAGGYVTARIAPKAGSTHAVVMGSMQTIFTVGALLTVGDSVTPLWLWIGGLATTIPAAWTGSRWEAARLQKNGPRPESSAGRAVTSSSAS